MNEFNEDIVGFLIEQLQKIDDRHPTRTPAVARIKPYVDFVPIINDTRLDLDSVDPHKVKFLSDTHFGHQNIITYCNRPFVSTDEMTEHIIEQYRKTVLSDDVVVWVGDVAFKGHTIINELLQTLPGYKILIMGNHDFERRTKRPIPYSFDEVHLITNVHNFIVSHHPLWDVPDGYLNIHGHTHTTTIPGGKHINVCVEHTNYTPISLFEIQQSLLTSGLPKD